jgi:8-oxo-dGTP pyrophosphatase MutT (NUDIX family)
MNVFERLNPLALRERFSDPPVWEPEMLNDKITLKKRDPAAAAVLVPLVARPEGMSVLLTQRTAHLNDHAGQISFPGGRCETSDASHIHTALRETEEEIGLLPHHIEVVGQLPVYTTASNFHVTPVVAIVHPPFELSLDAFEVAEAFEVPLQFLMDADNHQKKSFATEQGERFFYAMPWVSESGREYFIWGATAAMLRNLYQFLSL